MSQVFAPSTPLETLVHAGDYDGTIAYLRSLAVSERLRLRASVVRMIKLLSEARWKSPKDKGLRWDSHGSKEQLRAAGGAIVLCGSADDVAQAWVDVEDIITLSREFELPCRPELANGLLRRTPNTINAVQRLLVAGVVTRPDSSEYALGLMSLPHVCGRNKCLDDYFAEDPGLVHAVLCVFDVEGTAETSLASADKYNSNAWSQQLQSMCRNGVFERATLLDKTLSALERDWPQYRSGWFSRFHADLAPTAAELQANAARYLQLCHSRIPPTVSLALDALGVLDSSGSIDPATTLATLRPVMVSGSKGQVESALKLLDRCVARDASLEDKAALLACAGLVHEAAPLQAKILQRLAKQPVAEQVRNELRRYVPGIAASNRATLLRLVGEANAPASVVPATGVEPKAAPKAAVNALDEGRRLQTFSGIDELIQAIAYLFENDTDIDAFERVLAALVTAAPIVSADRSRFGPVLKRSAKLRKPLAIELGRLLNFVVDNKRLPAISFMDSGGRPSQILKLLNARIDRLMDLAAQGKRVTPLSTPTHRRGFIAPVELIERARLHQQSGVRDSTSDQVLALLRLAPGSTDRDREAARALADSSFARALRYALGDEVATSEDQALFCAAARIRYPQADDVVLAKTYGDLGPDGPKAARYAWEVSSWKSTSEPVFWHHDLIVRSGERDYDVGDLLAIARHPRPRERTSWGSYQQTSIAGVDPGAVAYSASLVPSDMEAFFAEGVRAIGNNLDWWEAEWQNKAYLEPLLDATVMPGPMAMLLLACALGEKEPGQSALAVDALVRMRAEGRLPMELLSATLKRLLATPLVKLARYRKSLDAALRIDQGLAPTIIELLSAALPFTADGPPKDIAQLLELLHELLIQTGGHLAPGVRDAIEKMKLGGNGKAVQKKLLAISR